MTPSFCHWSRRRLYPDFCSYIIELQNHRIIQVRWDFWRSLIQPPTSPRLNLTFRSGYLVPCPVQFRNCSKREIPQPLRGHVAACPPWKIIWLYPARIFFLTARDRFLSVFLWCISVKGVTPSLPYSPFMSP